MSKQAMISVTISKLSSMGIQCTSGGNSDLFINQDFLEAGRKNGRRKINYQASALFSEMEHTIYLWELAKDPGASIKSIHYGLDGTAYEIKLELGTIHIAFKETAKQFGWKLKIVSKKEKASYPEGVYSVPITSGQQFNELPQQYSAFVDYPAMAYAQRANTKGAGAFWAAFIFITLITSIFLLIGGNDETGWVISAVVLVLYLVFGRSFSAKGCLFQIVIFTSFTIILTMVFIFTSPDGIMNTGDNTASNAGLPRDSAPTAALVSDTDANAVKEKPVFRIDYLNYEMFTGYTYTDDILQNRNLSAAGDITFLLYCNPAAYGKPDDKVSRINMTVKAVKGPAVGKVKLYRMSIQDISAPTLPEEQSRYALSRSADLFVEEEYSEYVNSYNFLLSFYNDMNYGRIRIYYCIEDIMPVDDTLPTWEDSVTAANLAGITSDSVRSTVGIELNMEMASGDKHRIYFEREMVPGDFFVKGGRKIVTEDYQGRETPIVSTVVK